MRSTLVARGYESYGDECLPPLLQLLRAMVATMHLPWQRYVPAVPPFCPLG